MPRRGSAQRKRIIADPKYNSVNLSKFIVRMMLRGKKTVATHIVYDALAIAQKQVKKEPIEIFNKALENVKPVLEVKSRRVGGSTYQVPIEIRDERREALAMRWIIQFARNRHGKSMSQKLAGELAGAFHATGSSFKKKEDTHRMAEANKAFAHYRW